MRKIIFITSGKIDYILPGYTLYQSIHRTAAGMEFPHLTNDGVSEVEKMAQHLDIFSFEIIYSATTAQVIDTAEVLGKHLDITVFKNDNLNPLLFNILNILPENEFFDAKENAFVELRHRFLAAFWADTLLTPKTMIRTQLQKLLKITDRNKAALMVSHAYLIKLFEVYVKIGDVMFTNYKELLRVLPPEQLFMDRLEMLELDFNSPHVKKLLTEKA